MTWLRRLVERFRGHAGDAALAEELEAHRAFAQAELERSGGSAADAAAESRRRMGNVLLAREDSREVWVIRWLDQLRQNVRYGLRGLRREPAFALSAILTLALGTTAATTVFSVVDAELWKALPYREPSRLVQVMAKTPAARPETAPITVPELLEWRAGAPAFSELAASVWSSRRTAHVGRAESISVAEVTANYFELLGRRPTLGRVFTPSDGRGAAGVVLSDRGWRRVFDADPSVVGRRFMLDKTPLVVWGVVEADDTMGTDAEMFVAIDEQPTASAGKAPALYGAIGRLADGATPAVAQQQVQALINRRAAHDAARTGHTAVITDLGESYKTRTSGPLYFFLGASSLVLLLTIVNVAGLMLSRVFRRAPEFALRGALGGGGRVIAMQLAIESALIAVPGCALGMLLAYQLVGLVGTVIPPDFLFRGTRIVVDLRVVAFVLALALVTTVSLVLIPLGIARRANTAAVGSGDRTVGGPRSGRVRNVLLGAQLALTVVLLVGAGVFLKSFAALLREPLGFDPSDGWSARIVLSGPQYASDDQLRGYAARLAANGRAIPGVSAASISTSSPLRSGWLAMATPKGRTKKTNAQRTVFRSVDADYFSTIRTRIVRGRAISAIDVAGAPAVAVVNEQFVRKVFPDADPIGQEIEIDGARTAMVRPGMVVIVGVASNIKEVSINESEFAAVYVSFMQQPAPQIELIVRGNGNDASMPSALRAAAAAVDPLIPVAGSSTLDRRVDVALQGDRFNLILVTGLGVLALLIAGIGVYGAMAYAATARWREFGVRLALGATPRGLIITTLWAAARVALAGGAVGLAGAIVISTLVGDSLYLVQGVHTGVLFNVKITDPAALGGAVVGVVLLAVVAGVAPARRAARIDPVKSLRAE